MASPGRTDLLVELDMHRFFNPALLEDQVAVVTGGGSGLGYWAALALGQLGARVIIAGRHSDRLVEAATCLEQQHVDVLWRTLDIRDRPAVDRFFEAVVEGQGRIDILVNNAGGQFVSEAEQLTPNGWLSVIDLNLNGTWWCTRAAARPMIASGRGGKILNVVTSFAERSSAGMVHSGAARAGVVHMTRTLAREWARHGIRVNAIGPQVATDAVRSYYGTDGVAYVARATPMGRWGSAEEIAVWMVAYCSPMAGYVTGTMLPVDGGNAAGEGLTFLNTEVP